jgi:hypothetical protein
MYDGNGFFDQFIERVIQRVDDESRASFSAYGNRVPAEEVDIRVSADGYVRSSSKWGKHMELILGFVQVCEAIEEEGKRNRGEQP